MMKRPLLAFAIFFGGIALLQTGQDFLHSYLNGYTGYLADSLVFKIYWILYVPVLSSLFVYAAHIKQKMPATSFWKVAIVSTFLLSIVHILLVSLLIVAVSHLFFNNPFQFSTPLRYFASEHSYLTLFFYGAGFALILYGNQEQRVPLGTTEAPAYPDFIPVLVQNRLIPIQVNDIISIRSDRPYISIQTLSRTYLHNTTLKAIQAKLNPTHFVRVHRSVIVNIKQVEHYKSRSNGDYDLRMKNGELVRMSRNYFPGFKKLLA